MNGRHFRLIAVFAIAAVVLAVAGVVLARSGGNDGDVAAPTSTAGTTVASSTTTSSVVSSTTTSSVVSSSTSPSTTTSSMPPQTTTISSSTTTTTTTAPTPPPLMLEADGIGGVAFGAPPDVAIDFAVSILGPPDRDTGWVDSFSEFGTCPPPEVRGVQWGEDPNGYTASFTLLFTKASTTHLAAGGEHLFGYDYYGGDVNLATQEGMTVGTTLAEARAMYPGIEIAVSPWDPTEGIWFIDDDPLDDSALSGFSSGRGSDDVITSILGGVTCGE